MTEPIAHPAKRLSFSTRTCPGCGQAFKVPIATADRLQLPEDCIVCAEARDALPVDPALVVTGEQQLRLQAARQQHLEQRMDALQADVRSILQALGIQSQQQTVVESGTSTY